MNKAATLFVDLKAIKVEDALIKEYGEKEVASAIERLKQITEKDNVMQLIQNNLISESNFFKLYLHKVAFLRPSAFIKNSNNGHVSALFKHCVYETN